MVPPTLEMVPTAEVLLGTPRLSSKKKNRHVQAAAEFLAARTVADAAAATAAVAITAATAATATAATAADAADATAAAAAIAASADGAPSAGVAAGTPRAGKVVLKV